MAEFASRNALILDEFLRTGPHILMIGDIELKRVYGSIRVKGMDPENPQDMLWITTARVDNGKIEKPGKVPQQIEDLLEEAIFQCMNLTA